MFNNNNMDNNSNCTICNKHFANKYNLNTHNKKFHKEIELIIEKKKFPCRICNKIYSCKQSRFVHEKKCKDKKEITINLITDIENKLIELEKKIDTNNINNNNNNKNINNNNSGIINQIIINNYKEDNHSYISNNFKDVLFKSLSNSNNYSKPIPRLIENIKFNPNHKENHNVKIKSDRSKISFVYDENKWKVINKNELLDELLNYGYDLFKQFFIERKDELNEEIINYYNKFKESYILKLKKKIKKKIENIAYIFTLNNDEFVLDK
jgi:hypothetical protein